jgi:hypothetical protein
MNEIIHQILWISDVFVKLKMENIFCKYLKKRSSIGSSLSSMKNGTTYVYVNNSSLIR